MREPLVRAADVCPVELAAAVIGGAWKMTIVKNLAVRTHRFAELGRAVGPVTARVLTRQLRDLEADGIVERTVYPEVPPRVEYSLTDLGRTLAPLVEQLNAWGKGYLAQVSPGDDGSCGAGPGADHSGGERPSADARGAIRS